jgi:hypothetical protein
VIDTAVSEETADLIYQSAVSAKVWGVYIPTSELDQEETYQGNSEMEKEDHEKANEYRKHLARRAIREFLRSKSKSITNEDWQNTHGTAVWVIASDTNDETEYHLDYAEQVRYATNVIFPPIYGGTLHVSPLTNLSSTIIEESSTLQGKKNLYPLEGGAFFVNTCGLKHYQKYGYKTRLQNKITTDEFEIISKNEEGWHKIPYQYRRGILCDGDYPHFSSRVRQLPEENGMRRVVVGFNLFPKEIGPFVQKFPEHSTAFNKYVKLSQTVAKKTLSIQKWTLENIKQNPKQAAFLKFLAKKMKEKNLLPSQQEKQNQSEMNKESEEEHDTFPEKNQTSIIA